MLTRAPQSFANSTAEVQDCHIYNTVVRGIIIESYAALEELQKWTTRLARKRDEKRWIIWFSINIQLTINEWGWVSYEELWRSRRVLSVFAVGSRRIAGIWCLRLSPMSGCWSCGATPWSRHLIVFDRQKPGINSEAVTKSVPRGFLKVTLMEKGTKFSFVLIANSTEIEFHHESKRIFYESLIRPVPTCWADVIKHCTFH